MVAADQLEPFRVRLDASYVYWAAHGDYVENYIDGGIYRVAKGGGAVQTLAAGEQEPLDFVVDDRHAYWVTGRSTVRRVALGGGTPETLFSDPDATPYIALAQDAEAIYWSSDRLDPTLEGAAIWRLAK